MKNMKLTLMMVGIMIFAGILHANGKVIRATDMGATMWSDLVDRKLGDVVVEFRQGDELPFTFEARGDLLETRQTTVSSILIKKNFWLRLYQDNVEISLDGTVFRKINEVLTGSLEARADSAQSGGVVDSINIIFKAFLK